MWPVHHSQTVVQDHGWVRIWWQDLIRQGGWKLSLHLLPSSVGAPGTLETLWQQMLARANPWVCPRVQVLLCLEKWLQLVSHADPLPSSVLEFYWPPVIATALPSNRGSGLLLGQLVLLLPWLWLLFEEVLNYWWDRFMKIYALSKIEVINTLYN